MLATSYRLAGLAAALLGLGVFATAANQESRPAGAYASNHKKSPLFVQKLDPAEDSQRPGLFYTAGLADQDPDRTAPSEGRDKDESRDQGHFDELEHPDRADPGEGAGQHWRPADQDFADSESNTLSEDRDPDAPWLAGSHPRERFVLTRKFANKTCAGHRGFPRFQTLGKTYLNYCSRHRVDMLYRVDIYNLIMEIDHECERILVEFVQLDETINQFDSLFTELLSRYNCHNGYSVKWNCDDCKKAYKDWLCATHLPVYMRAERVKPCISFCERVEQRCPYLHPITREQYGGQPVFICRDPNIPFVPEITPDIPYNEPGLCYDLCHLSGNLTELLTDSLSKYDYNKCPEHILIAERVRNASELNASLAEAAPPVYTPLNGPDKTSADASNSTPHVHMKKLHELLEVLKNYKNQSQTHRYHADHSSIEQSQAPSELTHSS